MAYETTHAVGIATGMEQTVKTTPDDSSIVTYATLCVAILHHASFEDISNVFASAINMSTSNTNTRRHKALLHYATLYCITFKHCIIYYTLLFYAVLRSAMQ